MQRFNSALHALYSDAKAVTDACDLLRSSTPLRRLLGLVLQLGNALNAGSFRSGAEGFRTDCLVRIAELRTNGASSSLLQFALATLDAKMSAEAAELSSEAGWEAPMARTTAFVGELGAVRAAAKVSIDELATEVGRLTKGLDSIRGELAHFEKEAAKTADDGERVGVMPAQRSRRSTWESCIGWASCYADLEQRHDGLTARNATTSTTATPSASVTLACSPSGVAPIAPTSRS